MNYEMRLQEKWEAGMKVGVTEGTLRTLMRFIRAMKDAGESDKGIFDLAHEISDGEIPDEKLRSIIANS